MNIRLLRVFVAVCREMSITKAGKALHLTQPAVSNAIAELEAYLGYKLFERRDRRLYITEAGQLLLERAAHFLAGYDELEQAARALGAKAPVRIGSTITLATNLLPGVIRAVEARFPGRQLLVTVHNAAAIQRLLAENRLDMAFLEGVFAQPRYVRHPLPPYALAVVCHPGYPLAAQAKISVPALAGEKLLLREKGSAIRDTFDSALLLRHQSARPMWESANSQVLLEAALAGIGVAVLPAFLVRDAVETGALAALRVEGLSLDCPNQIVIHESKPLDEVMQGVIDTAMEIAAGQG